MKYKCVELDKINMKSICEAIYNQMGTHDHQNERYEIIIPALLRDHEKLKELKQEFKKKKVYQYNDASFTIKDDFYIKSKEIDKDKFLNQYIRTYIKYKTCSVAVYYRKYINLEDFKLSYTKGE